MIRKKIAEELVWLYFLNNRDGQINEKKYDTLHNDVCVLNKDFVEYIRTNKRR